MANTETQNGQRGTIFLSFIAILFFCILNIINCVKKRIDPISAEEQGAAQKYKEGEAKEGEPKPEEIKKQKPPKKQKQEEVSTAQFDGLAISMKAQQVQQSDSPIIKVLKKNEQFQLLYFPLFLIFALNLVTGTSKAFSIVNYLFTLIIVFLFNVIKLHKKCGNHICLNLVFDNLWLLMVFFGMLNQWGAMPVAQPYILR